nr:hypothetical protein [Bacteroidota bacterium]
MLKKAKSGGLIFFSILYSWVSFAQSMKTPVQMPKEAVSGKAIVSEIQTTPFLATIELTDGPAFEPIMQSITISHPKSIPIDTVPEITYSSNHHEDGAGALHKTSEVATPVLNKSFYGATDSRYNPPDNSVAVSNAGLVLSVMNSNLRLYKTSGQVLTVRFFSDIFAEEFPSLTGKMFDPRVLYDPIADRFIMVLLHSNTYSTSNVMVLFSKTNDPRDGWNMYALKGDVLNSSSWFDFPAIGISKNELYITGNLFTNTNQFVQSVILQISKTDGYAAASNLRYRHWSNIYDATGGKSFSLVPASYGISGSYGPGIYLVSNTIGGNSNFVTLYEITDDLTAQDEKLNVYKVTNPFTYIPPRNSPQKGSTQLLNPLDNRIHGAFFIGNSIHYVYNTKGKTYNTIVYS